MKLYLIGDTTGFCNENKSDFMGAAARLKSLGHDVYYPDHKPTLARQIALIDALDVDAIALLPDWGQDLECCAIVAYARAVGIPCCNAADFSGRVLPAAIDEKHDAESATTGFAF